MSATEVIRQIEQLPAEERRKVEAWMHEGHLEAFDGMCETFDRLRLGEGLTEEEIIARALREKLR